MKPAPAQQAGPAEAATEEATEADMEVDTAAAGAVPAAAPPPHGRAPAAVKSLASTAIAISGRLDQKPGRSGATICPRLSTTS